MTTNQIVLARYSEIDVWETTINNVQVMRRVGDDHMNATQILKVAGHSKPRRTAILAEIHEWKHEKVQGGYGKYQGTWIALDYARSLARSHKVHEILAHILYFDKSTTTVLQKYSASQYTRVKRPGRSAAARSQHIPTPLATPQDSPKTTSADKSGRLVMSPTGLDSVIMKPIEVLQLLHSQAHPCLITAPPSLVLDNHGNTVMHWACALGHIRYLASLPRIPAKLFNKRHQSPLSFATTRCENYTRQSYSMLAPLFGNASACRDAVGRTFLHTIVALGAEGDRATAQRYYLECVAGWVDLQRDSDKDAGVEALLNAQDSMGNTALHLAVLLSLDMMVKILLSLKCRIDIPNKNGDTCYTLMKNLGQEYEHVLEILAENGWEFGCDLEKTRSEDKNIGDRVHGMIESTNASVHAEFSNRTRDIQECEYNVKDIQTQVQFALKKAREESAALVEENRLYVKLNDIIGRLESAIQNVKGDAASAAEEDGLDIRPSKKRRIEDARISGKYRQLMEKLMPGDASAIDDIVDALASQREM